MRIAISGAHGVGKSTLAVLLSTELQLPRIDEVARKVAVEMEISPRQIRKTDMATRRRFQAEILKRQLLEEFRYQATGFVSDRSVLDVIAYTIWYKIPDAKELQKNAVEYAKRNYDVIFYIPPSYMQLEDDGFRFIDQKSQEEIDKLLCGMFKKLPNMMIIKGQTPGERLGEALTWVGALREAYKKHRLEEFVKANMVFARQVIDKQQELFRTIDA